MTFRGWQTLIVALVAALGAGLASIAYTNASARESERKWCGVVTTLDDAYEVTPPQTPAGRKIAEDIARLRADFGCP
ncbi:hypothetical protein [Micromonospora sp. WMMD710]|uniref:hypothetical protein n=1 Tax=Micromonospora sp. WMMD710 TaxID=3016085 RepID=UPI00241648ED|nr:hypothetical protein [Micromonospora sp. WMMD710]MDG4762374.1 hypothetical protein [Micromonospora sp. WMMD710]MDG4762382.1 hypothetical protein [Micromonospora sp. WMMD710]MDG4762420.1 hypothetical protein [Micromonospora sp. WMMD710]MDG4762466.1 hypothetical protein [Micromonospora sp. WMMD710]MDG4762501.1 hypothetical protein [Micromonospora sp. WMMD710]